MSGGPPSLRAWAAGRVTLIGDHTDYTGGLVLPMAVDLGTTVVGAPGGARVVVRSAEEGGVADVPVDPLAAGVDPGSVEPPWARYVAAVVAEVGPAQGLDADVSTTLPLGSGLSSSAALEVALAVALGFRGTPQALARACQRAEHRATGVPTGVMDQLTSASAVEGHALLVDCATLAVLPVALPDGLEVVVVDSGERRALEATGYARRRQECEAAQAVVGPLRQATPADLEALDDPVLRRRARHVVTENARVAAMAAALATDDLATVGELLAASHASLRDDFEVSTPRLDALVGALAAVPGVIGARLTGAGFGGCAVALAGAGTDVGRLGVARWRVRPGGPPRLERLG
ncbi:MAG: galactokinase [Acidimicrobiales bacterium]